MRDGLVFANSLGFHRVQAGSDSLDVIKFCTGQSRWWDAAAAILAECVDMATYVRKVMFSHYPRAANMWPMS